MGRDLLKKNAFKGRIHQRKEGGGGGGGSGKGGCWIEPDATSFAKTASLESKKPWLKQWGRRVCYQKRAEEETISSTRSWSAR